MNELLTIGWKSVAPDLTSWHDRATRWLPGAVIDVGGKPGGPCPARNGDGVCLALDFAGASSASGPSIVAALVAYSEEDILGRQDGKIRVRRCSVLDIVDVSRLIRDGKFRGANLRGANFHRADLRWATLRGAIGLETAIK